MSCADVCLDMDYDGDNEFHVATPRRARRLHRCCECRETIAVGATYEDVRGKSGGMVWTAKTCETCCAIRSALVCGRWMYGELWERIEEAVFPEWLRVGPYDCLAQIESRAARDAIRERFDEWRAGRR